ncbi:histidine--tRNA ligase [archaeon 13_1_20CM_2_54_9]|nr:MAG: histidine--tRNA ligase [Crenarchaeota archaeon 13_1_40CM_3_53_5]OLE76627.1 MAG: histidine--tRNA ligase [archaeon 13_1_20CM_2_54_9]
MSEPQFTIPRGMRDIEPDEMAHRIWLADKIRQVLWSHGFQLLEPSPLENLETLEAKSGPEIRDQVYWFKDKGGRDLGLRFDLTVGMTRMVANRLDLPVPIKVACIGGNWRYEEPQFGRYRYFTQWDAEIYGVTEPTADAEIIATGSDILDAVGLKDHVIRISNRKLLEGFLRSLGIQTQPELERFFRVVDKLGKIGPGQAERELATAGLSKDQIRSILGFAGMGGDPAKVMGDLEKRLPKGEMITKGFQELSGTIEAAEYLGKLSKCTVDLGIVRGIGYYDGTVYEGFDRDADDLGSIFGGGRFDKLTKTYGKRDMPATGVAGGIERLMLSLDRKKLFPDLEQRPEAFVVTVNESLRREGLKIVERLREAGIRTDYDLKQRTLQKQLEYANAVGARVTVIVGPRELEEGKVRLRDMKSGKERDVPQSLVAEEVQKNAS